jgi:hypothetical protein
MDIQLPGESQSLGEAAQLPLVLLESWIELRIHEIQHRPHPPGGDPHLVQAFRVFLPAIHLAESQETFQAGFQSPVQE